jgi:hypothetical protein
MTPVACRPSVLDHLRVVRRRLPVDGVKPFVEPLGSAKLPFTNDGPNDNSSANACSHDGDGDDSITSNMGAGT